jgi:hypothetical protein
MGIVIFGVIIAVALAGLAVRAILEARGSDARITWREYAIGMAISPVVAILVAWAGWVGARNSQLAFTEYWNGWEVAAVKSATTCERDGSCRWDYQCDPYRCSYECGGYEGSGKNRRYVSRTCWKTCYHQCPYVDSEYHYTVATTLGSYTIAGNVFPENPQTHRWRASESIPQDVINGAGVGDPPFWVSANTRCLASQPGPVTARKSYQNFILASDRTLMKEHSGDIKGYQAKNLLPTLQHGIQAFYYADKVSFVGWQPSNRIVWQDALARLNGALGVELQGDLHLVIIKDEAVTVNPERYVLALKAYWQDKESWHADTLSKNAVVVVLGTADGLTVSWSRLFTGMPLGNEKLIVVMRDGLKGQPLTPESLIGPPVGQRDAKGVHYPPQGQTSVLQRFLWGLDDPTTKFARVKMSGKDGKSGFLYLRNEIQPTTGQLWAIIIVTFLFGCGVWVWAAVHFDPSERRRW